MSEWLLVFEEHKAGRTTHVPVILSTSDDGFTRDGACAIARNWWGDPVMKTEWMDWPDGSVCQTGIWWMTVNARFPMTSSQRGTCRLPTVEHIFI